MLSVVISSIININHSSFRLIHLLRREIPIPLSFMNTPYYLYDLSLLRKTLNTIREQVAGYNYKVHYAIKANNDARILQEIAAAGFGVDSVSIGEIHHAIKCGFHPSNIAYAGVGKTDKEIAEAIDLGIGCFNVESVEELQIISEIAAAKGAVANVALRINPDIDAHTHHYITTGLAENKFGISLHLLDRALQLAKSLPAINMRGFHFHIGSQILTNEPFALLCSRIIPILRKAQVEYGFSSIDYINVGGGLGIDYDNPMENPIPDFKGYFDTFKQNLPLPEGIQLHFELGRAVVAQCGSLITKVIYVKQCQSKQIVIVDAGMNNLIRPALYQAYHKIENLSARGEEQAVYDVVGPICESSDTFAEARTLPVTRRGDILAIRSAGAYGASMASCYNMRPEAPAVYSEE